VQRTLVFGLNEASISMGLIGSIVAGWVPSMLAPTLGVTAKMPSHIAARC
jgi:hypothetical protein